MLLRSKTGGGTVNEQRSKGAPYVKSRRQQILMWDDDGIPKLLWSSRWAIFVSATGEERKLYGLSFADAQAMCRIHGVAFYNQDATPKV